VSTNGGGTGVSISVGGTGASVMGVYVGEANSGVAVGVSILLAITKTGSSAVTVVVATDFGSGVATTAPEDPQATQSPRIRPTSTASLAALTQESSLRFLITIAPLVRQRWTTLVMFFAIRSLTLTPDGCCCNPGLPQRVALTARALR